MDYHFELGKFTENELEQAIIELFKNEDYEYIHGDYIERQYNDVLIETDLRRYLANRYSEDSLSDVEISKIINNIEHINSTPLYSGNKETFSLINSGFNLKRDDLNSIALHVDYIDYENIENNIFKVVNQFKVQGSRMRIPDVLLFINGIPVGIFEFKSAIEEDKTIHDAWEQITIRYARDIPNLLKYCALSVISDGANTKLGSVFTPYEYYYSWNKANDEEKVSNGISSLLTMIKGAFAKERVLQILRDFVFYPDNSSKDEVFICRYPQFFGATKMLNNIKEHMKPNGDGKGGTYWGATGCGKTITMLYLSRLITLRDSDVFDNPTIIILTDREDLDNQTTKLFVTGKTFLNQSDVRSFESRADLQQTLLNKPSGGIYITTIQKFCEDTGLLSDRSNIICISDEAHRTQLGVDSKLKKTEHGVYTTYGFAYYLRESLPNATYCGFTGTPIDETEAVFGKVVDSYTMKESSDDGITVRIAYEPRLARVMLSEEQAHEIEEYYKRCSEIGSTEEQIEQSKKDMTRMNVILGDPQRIKKLAADVVEHYEKLCNEKPEVVQKAMIVCSDRRIAMNVLDEIVAIRKEWGIKRKADNEELLSEDELDKLVPLAKINLVATQGQNDDPKLYEMCGSGAYRKMLDEQFKDNNSNFKIAVVVDMWITGFDVPSLSVMYIDKPIQKHTLIQTISRVNRVFEGKDEGLVVDYIGFKGDMLEAVKKYGNPKDSPIDELYISLGIFRNQLSIIDDMMSDFNASKFYRGSPLERLNCLNDAAEFVQQSNELQKNFMFVSKRLKSAYSICYPSGELSKEEVSKAQFYLAIRSIIYKQTKGEAPDAEIMNKVVEKMVQEAITCTGVENIIDDNKSIDIFGEEFLKELDTIKMPITKFNALLKLLKQAINNYGKINKVKSVDFSERLKRVIDAYNTRDKLIFTSEVVADFVNDLSDQLIQLLSDLKEDQKSFESMGITYEEKAFYDILVKVRDSHGFHYEEEKCLILAKKIKELVDDKTKFANWSTKDDVKNELNMDLTILLYDNGYPPQWDDEVFEKVLEQAENFKKYN